jgi:hypothetical protein
MSRFFGGVIALVLSFGAALPAFAQHDDQDRGWRPGAGWDRDIDVRCASQSYGYNMCQVDTGRGSDVRLVRQLSKTRCEEGRNWGWNRAGIWVDQGCEGVFRVARRWQGGGQGPGPGNGGGGGGGGGGGDWHPGAGWDRAIRLQCASQGYQYNLCQVDTGRGGDVRVERQISKTRCIEGQTWGWNRAGVWVDGGCEAIFRVNRRWR